MNTVAAVVVTYNRWELLGECMEALLHQTHPLSHIVLIDNASTDERYQSGMWPWKGNEKVMADSDASNMDVEKNSDDKPSQPQIYIERLPENIGGAGGFSYGVGVAREYQDDWILILDDDCILETDYVEKLLKYYECEKKVADQAVNLSTIHDADTKEIPNSNGDNALMSTAKPIGALCGTVYTDGKLMTDHRGYLTSLKKHVLLPLDTWHEHPEADYEAETLECSVVSFCGVMVRTEIINQIGLPKKEYFIRCDDIEYTLRISKLAQIINVCGAKLNHKVKVTSGLQKFDWKVYYDIRNAMDMTTKHGLWLVHLKFQIKYLLKAILFACKNRTLSSLRLYWDALQDAKKGKMGLNRKYF